MSTIRGHININTDLTQVVGDEHYELSNHLGNVLQVVTDRKLAIDNGEFDLETYTYTSATPDGIIDFFTSDVVSQSDYYPFGMLLPNRNESDADYRYGYQGSEMDNEVRESKGSSYTTHFRQLDPRVGRWLSIDPMEKSLPSQSPYCTMDNNPIWFNDPLGDIVTPSGDKKLQRKYVRTLNRLGKNKYGIVDGELIVKKVSQKANNFDRAQVNAIWSDDNIPVILVTKSDQIYIDSYVTGEVDLSDIKAGRGKKGRALTASMITHFMVERTVVNGGYGNKTQSQRQNDISSGVFTTAHITALKEELTTFNEMTGESATRRGGGGVSNFKNGNKKGGPAVVADTEIILGTITYTRKVDVDYTSGKPSAGADLLGKKWKVKK